MSATLFDGIDELVEQVTSENIGLEGVIVAVERIVRDATAEQLANEIRKPSSGQPMFRQMVRDEALARILTASAL